jgi:glycosyltransferase involved in cell wall biosynthesis
MPLRIERGGTHPADELRTIRDLVRVYRSFRPDIVHHVTIKPVVYGSIAARSLGIRRVVNAVTGLGYAFIPRADDDLRHQALSHIVSFGFRFAFDGASTRVIFQNEADRSAFVDRGLVSASRTVLIRGAGVDFSRFIATPLPEGDPVALLPARLLWDKGVGEFVEAATRLKAEGVRARFVLLGPIDPANPAAIERSRVEEWVKSGVIEWWGMCEHSEMPATLARAHLVVLPSYREGLPLALAEAAASGRACVTTDVPGCRDVMKPGETGWLVPARDPSALADALRAGVTDRAELSRRGSRAAEVARAELGLDMVVRRTHALYDELIGTSA